MLRLTFWLRRCAADGRDSWDDGATCSSSRYIPLRPVNACDDGRKIYIVFSPGTKVTVSDLPLKMAILPLSAELPAG